MIGAATIEVQIGIIQGNIGYIGIMEKKTETTIMGYIGVI